MSLAAHSKFRQSMLAAVETEIVGPSDEFEVLRGLSPDRRYVIGQLRARNDEVAVADLSAGADALLESAESVEGDAGDEVGFADVDLKQQSVISGIGVSFVCEVDARVLCSASWGRYELCDDSDERSWKRRPENYQGVISFGAHDTFEKRELADSMLLHIVSRLDGGRHICSVFLSNNARGESVESRVFQPRLMLEGREGNLPFVAREQHLGDLAQLDDEARGLALIYRRQQTLAIGRHVAVRAINVSQSGQRCGGLITELLPAVELRRTTPNEISSMGAGLDMATLADCSDKEEMAALLRPLVREYVGWLDTRNLALLPAQLRATAEERINECRRRAERIAGGLKILQSDDAVFAAFRAANEAMARARFRGPLLEPAAVRTPANLALVGRSGAWRPFQLAFLLSLIPELSQPRRFAASRELFDILFFPTGGGKTEAYLGLIAFCACLRRFPASDHVGAGVSAVLRYTLRLLSTQQYTRVATLICALETMRRSGSPDAHEWLSAREPFSIGLWIGSAHSPNTFDAAREALVAEQLRHAQCEKPNCSLANEPKATLSESRSDPASSPLVFSECPWCGAPLCPADVYSIKSAQRTVIVCPEAQCAFGRRLDNADKTWAELRDIGLPMLTVDDEIFRSCPTVVIGTADKYATLWYRPEARRLFGYVERRCAQHGYLSDSDESHAHRPPKAAATQVAEFPPIDLAIQDELHLITEALGSAYGFMELVFDRLAERGGVRPKKIGATATIRRAREQVRLLYGLPASIFPEAPIDAGETFFSSEHEPSPDAPGRLFVGAYAPGQSRLYALDQLIASVLDSTHRQLEGVPWSETSLHDVGDPYQTLVLYFNSLRDLGQVLGLLVDDIPRHLQEIAAHRGGEARMLDDVKSELTSKTTQAELRETMSRLWKKYSDEKLHGRPGCDTVCATNMFSVGIDIGRLGLMVVDGQPKTTAEYIQATSRVGRKYPGVIFTLYNWARPRDLSHYEHFYDYHNAIYRDVETPSVTPYSFGTLDKYGSNAVVALYRLLFGYSADDRPMPFESRAFSEVLDTLISRIQENGLASEVAYAAERIAEIREEWRSAADSSSDLQYVYSKSVSMKRKSSGMFVGRVASADSARPQDVLFDIPMSLRNVEPELEMVVDLEKS